MSQICRYYLKGTCKYGNSCHFLHENNSYSKNREYSDYSHNYSRNYHQHENYSSQRNREYSQPTHHDYSQNYYKSYNRYHVDHRQSSHNQQIPAKSSEELSVAQFFEIIRGEIEQFQVKHVWPLTVIAPIKNYGNIPGFKDYSPEEIRYQFYLASSSNSFLDFKKNIEDLKQNVLQTCHQFKSKSSAAFNVAKQMMTKSYNQFEESTTSIFQSSSPQSSGFTFDLNALPNNAGFTQSPQSFTNANVFNSAPQFSQNTSIFSGNNQVQTEWNNHSTSSAPPLQQNNQINSFSFNLDNLNAQNTVVQPPFSVNVEPSIPQINNTVNAQSSYPFSSKPGDSQIGNDPCYSKLNELTPEYLQAFQGKTFKYGNIPLKPPPKELCY